MPQRIDIEGGDAQQEIDEALRQLTQRGQKVERATDLERSVQEVGEQQLKQIGSHRKTAPSLWPARLAWIGISSAVIALIVITVVLTRPEPLPPPATTAEGAVKGFWTALIAEDYEGATVYYPSMVATYGSRKQAAARLRELFKSNPPANLRPVGVPELIPNSTNYRVTYEVYKRSGLPTVGEFTVTDTGNPATGFIIISGGW